jgi:hypothetical protein
MPRKSKKRKSNANEIRQLEQQSELPESAVVFATSQSQTLKARLSRRWTHNEQLMVRPCGVILARGTMYGSENVSSVAVSKV